MSEQIDWSKAPEGATHYVVGSIHPFEKRVGDDWFYYVGGAWARIYRKGDDRITSSALAVVPRRTTPSWSGEGLPPAGVVCEMHYCGEWEKTEILCIGVKHVFIRQIAVTGEAFECSLNLSACQFRPIRTPEQIAADEREAAIKEMTANYAKNSDTLAGWAAYVYDTLGYRKP